MTTTIFSPVQQKMLFNQIKESNFFKSLINDGNFFDFLSNIWNIDTLPSSDPRFNNLRGDIQQHMFNNDDWDYDYLFSEVLQLFKKEDLFNKFITETVNPIYHNHDSQLILIATINEYLLPKNTFLSLMRLMRMEIFRIKLNHTRQLLMIVQLWKIIFRFYWNDAHKDMLIKFLHTADPINFHHLLWS